MHDRLCCGRSTRTFNELDESNWEALGIHVATNIPSVWVTRYLDQLIEHFGKPKPFTDWCKENEIEILYTQLGKPDQNAFIDRFNLTFREGVLDAYLLDQSQR
jgi:putative transposase